MRGVRCRAPLDRVDLNEQNVVALDIVEQGIERGGTCVAAVPIRLTLNLDRLEEHGQAGRSHDVGGGEFAALKDVTVAGPDVRGRDEQLDSSCLAQTLEVDQFVDGHRQLVC